MLTRAPAKDNKQQPKHTSKLDKEIQLQMAKPVAEETGVAEICSPPRAAREATEMGPQGGWSLDATTKGEDGNGWDFSRKEFGTRAIQKINCNMPLGIIGSPVRTGWSTMVNLDWGRGT